MVRKRCYKHQRRLLGINMNYLQMLLIIANKVCRARVHQFELSIQVHFVIFVRIGVMMISFHILGCGYSFHKFSYFCNLYLAVCEYCWKYSLENCPNLLTKLQSNINNPIKKKKKKSNINNISIKQDMLKLTYK